MKKVGLLLKRDVKRLLRVPQAWIIVIGVIFTPALYAWFNIAAFWDPYSNTANIKVAVVNLDQGAESSLTGPIDIGAQIVEQLEQNDQLGWEFLPEDRAMEAVKSGSAYAAILIPATFSQDLLSVTTGTFEQPTLQYYVNEKANAIAPKITDVGATQLDRQISSAFIEQVTEAAATALKTAGSTVETHLVNAKIRTLTAFDKAVTTIESTREKISTLNLDLDESRGAITSSSQTLEDIKTTLTDVQTALDQTQVLVGEAQQQILTFTTDLSTAYVESSTQMATASASANTAIAEFTGTLDQASADVGTAIEQATKANQASAQAIEQIEALINEAGLTPEVSAQLSAILATLETKNQVDQQILTDLGTLNTDILGITESISTSADAFAQAAQSAQTSATEMNTALAQSIPELSGAMSTLAVEAGSFSSALSAQQSQLTQAQTLLTSLDEQIIATSEALVSLDKNLAGVEESLTSASTDVVALGAASTWSELTKITDLAPQEIARFVASPVEVNENVVFPVNSYGSAMAALFTNLSLWIGAFVLMVIFRTEVDGEDIPGLTIKEAYVGRFLLFAVLATAQAIVVCVGNLILGVQTVSAIAFIATGVFVALAYLSIIYALCVALGHIGRGLCILLVIMQIPGASGLYPIEMMPGFFRALYPFLPFTYGIDAMRETIAGFYDGAYWGYVGSLLLFVILSFVLGLALRQQLANLNMVFSREIIATDLLIAQEVELTGRRYRLTDIVHALSDRAEYRAEIERRSQPFTHHYHQLLRSTVVVGAVGLVVLGVIAWLIPEGKATLLGIWLLWCLLIMGFLVSVEYVKQSLQLATEIEDLTEHDLLAAASSRSAGKQRQPAPSAVVGSARTGGTE